MLLVLFLEIVLFVVAVCVLIRCKWVVSKPRERVDMTENEYERIEYAENEQCVSRHLGVVPTGGGGGGFGLVGLDVGRLRWRVYMPLSPLSGFVCGEYLRISSLMREFSVAMTFLAQNC